jgi:hypothetical protein
VGPQGIRQTFLCLLCLFAATSLAPCRAARSENAKVNCRQKAQKAQNERNLPLSFCALYGESSPRPVARAKEPEARDHGNDRFGFPITSYLDPSRYLRSR